jgi:hypothetical protein
MRVGHFFPTEFANFKAHKALYAQRKRQAFGPGQNVRVAMTRWQAPSFSGRWRRLRT